MVIAEKEKTAHSVGMNDKENITILFPANTNEDIVTKLILLAYQRLPSPVIKQIPEDWSLGKSPNGWMTAEAFFEYMGTFQFSFKLSLMLLLNFILN